MNTLKINIKNLLKMSLIGTLERSELIEETVNKHLADDIDLKKTDKLLKIILFAAIYELLFKHNNPKKLSLVNIY